MEYIDDSKLNDLINEEKTFALVASAVWCGPCKSYNTILENVIKDEHAPAIYKVDIDEQTDIAQGYKIRSVPTTIVFKEGKVQKMIPGVINKETLLSLFA